MELIPLDNNDEVIFEFNYHHRNCNGLKGGLCGCKERIYNTETQRWEEKPSKHKWVELNHFSDVMKIEKGGGRYMNFTSEVTGKKYIMFSKHLTKMLQETVVDHGKVSGLWSVRRTFGKYALRFEANS